MIYFTRFVHNKSIKIVILYYDELIGKKGKKCLMADDYMLYRVLDKIKEIIRITKPDDTKVLIDTNEKLSHDITLKTVLILTTFFMKDDGKLYLRLFLEKTLFVK